VWLQRELGELARDGRPLSAGDGALERLYAERQPLYAALADIRIGNDAAPDAVAERLLQQL
ncbi:MAG: shikimate kinase, partial [Firmicutes bacterium]|nr:shikimate kinase [Bacillota bacterium]